MNYRFQSHLGPMFLRPHYGVFKSVNVHIQRYVMPCVCVCVSKKHKSYINANMNV